jgi:WD40 repeat protein
LQGLGLDVDLRRVELLDAANRKHPVPLCRSPQAGAVRFDRLPNPGPGQRLILVSDGAFLLDGPGKWQPWARAARLERWPRRTVFSPREPRNLLRGLDVLDHGMRPGDPGFLVLPQEESALEAWAAWLATGQMPVIVPAEAQRFPRLIAERGEQRYLDDNFEPEAGEVARLLGELGVYLGDNGFYWLCCCAVPPLLDSKLALLLGEAYLRRAGVGDEAALRYHLARNYRLLARLPWLRRQDMPDWLRLALLARLSSALQEEVRRAVDGLLSPLSQDPEGSLRLGFGLPDGPAKSPAPDRKTALYLGFMDGLSARQLMLRMPGRWRSWLGRLERGRSPWQRLKDWLAAAFARALFRDGLRRQGPALAVWLWMALSSSLLATAYYWPPPQWPESARGLLFAEDAQPLRFRHDAAVKSIAYGPGGRRLLTASADGNVRLWDTQTGRPLGQPIWHGEPLQQAAFSLDGTQIVTAGGQTARLWDAETGQALGQPLRHGGLVYRAAFSPDGKRVVTVGNDHTAKLWDAQSGRLLFKLQHENRVNDARFSPDGRRVLTASHDSSARLWDAQTGQFIAEMRHLAFVSRAVFSPDGKMIATASGDNSARLWDAQTGQSAGQPLSHEDWVNDVQFSPDSTRLLTASKDNTARLWDVHGSQPLGEPLKHGDDVWSARFNGGGDKVITASADHSARVWDAKTQKPLGEPLTQAAAVALAEFSPDGQQAATACADGEARLWNTQIGVSAGEAMRHESIINHAAYSPDGRRVVTASSDHTARLWDAQTGKPLGDAMRHEDWVNHAAFSRDGQYVATASRDGTARLWDAMTGKPLGDPMRHGSSVNYAEFSPDGGRLIVAGRDGVAQLWDVKTGKPLGDSMRHESSINHAEFSPDGQRVVTASNDKTAKQWNAQTGAPIGGPMRHEGSVSHAAYSPVGERIATASYDDTARLWDAKTNLALGDPMRHGRPVNDATFSPDGKTVATASWDNTAKLWDANNGQLLAKPLPHESLVRQARFSPDGKRIVTTSDDHTARLWDADTGMPLGVLPTSGVFLSAAFHSRGDRVLLAGTVENEPTLKKAIPAKPGDHEQSVKEQLFSLLPPSSKGEARIWRLPPYPEPRTAFQFSPASLTAAALALPPLLFALERVWHLLAMRRLRRRLDNYAPRGKAKPGAARTTGGPPPP